jgi:ADP-ribosylglycohydrolase
MIELIDRIAACLKGGAIGDAIGAHFEGKSTPINFRIPDVLQVTDDTQLTLATCESIIAEKSVCPESIANRFLRWYRERRITGIGSCTLKALTELEAGGHWAIVGATGERAAGNGAAMRIAPLAFVLDPDIDSDRQTIRDVCRITHRHDEAYLGALAIVRSIRYVLAGNRLDMSLFDHLINTLSDCRVRDRFIEVRETAPTIQQYAIKFSTSGYVVDSVAMAVLAVVQPTQFMQTIEQIVSCGGDTDTIASMFGHIYGAAHGCAAVPLQLVERIDEAELLIATAASFGTVVRRINLKGR